MLSIKQIEQQLHNNKWSITSYDSYIFENMYLKIDQIISDQEEMKSMLWAVSLNEKGRSTSVFKIILVTNSNIYFLSSDSNISPTKIKIQKLDLDLLQHISIEPSNFNHGSFRINLIYGTEIMLLESIDELSSIHFVKTVKNYVINKSFDNAAANDDHKTVDSTIIEQFKTVKSKILKQEEIIAKVNKVSNKSLIISMSLLMGTAFIFALFPFINQNSGTFLIISSVALFIISLVGLGSSIINLWHKKNQINGFKNYLFIMGIVSFWIFIFSLIVFGGALDTSVPLISFTSPTIIVIIGILAYNFKMFFAQNHLEKSST